MTDYAVRPLSELTWADFADLAERHNGVWNGCWCLGFHAGGEVRTSHEQRRQDKHALVLADRAHAALVYDLETCVGWCQFGPTGELPNIKSRKAYLAVNPELPDWRITCFFVDKAYRRQGVAAAGLGGALAEIARLGGGTVESYPEDAGDRKVSSSFLHNGTLALFERHGFERVRKIATHRWVVQTVVDVP